MMTAWISDELGRIESAEEVEIAHAVANQWHAVSASVCVKVSDTVSTPFRPAPQSSVERCGGKET